jgi:hypothetical protein
MRKPSLTQPKYDDSAQYPPCMGGTLRCKRHERGECPKEQPK